MSQLTDEEAPVTRQRAVSQAEDWELSNDRFVQQLNDAYGPPDLTIYAEDLE